MKRLAQKRYRCRPHAVQLGEIGLGDLSELIQPRIPGGGQRAACRRGEFGKARLIIVAQLKARRLRSRTPAAGSEAERRFLRARLDALSQPGGH